MAWNDIQCIITALQTLEFEIQTEWTEKWLNSWAQTAVISGMKSSCRSVTSGVCQG